MRTRNTILTVAAIVVATAWAPIALAFPNVQFWHMASSGVAGTNRAGAGGIYGTGGQTDHGIRCSHCHVRGAGTIGMNVTAAPAFGSVGGEDAYTPGTRYRITIAMTGEHLRAGMTMDNYNAMAATIEDASGRVAGRFVADDGRDSASCPSANPYATATQPAGRTTTLYGDCHGVLPLGHQGLTSWTFDWIAPSAGAGDLTLFVGMVDGDHGGDSSLDDDTLERAIPLREGP